MSKRRIVILLAMAMMAAGTTLTGCSGSGTTASAPAAAAKTADVRISAVFPGTANTAAVKSLLPDATQAIEVYAYQPQTSGTYVQPTLIATLTKASPSATVKLAPGNYYFQAFAYDSTDKTTRNQLAGTYTGGVLNAGSNTVNLTFLDGTWTLVNENAVPTPLELSNGKQLTSITVGYTANAVKTAIDTSKPYASSLAPATFTFTDGSSVSTEGGFLAQFSSAVNQLILGTKEPFNLTKECRVRDSSCGLNPGDSMVFIPGIEKYDIGHESGGTHTSAIMFGDASSLLPNKGEDTFKVGETAYDLFADFIAATTADGKIMTGQFVEFKVDSSAQTLSTTPTPAAAAKATVKKSAQSATTKTIPNLTITEYSIALCSTATTHNPGTWPVTGITPVTFGNASCYIGLPEYITYQSPTDPGTYSFGLTPAGTEPSDLGDYCHEYSYNQQTLSNTCLSRLPPEGPAGQRVYLPSRFVNLTGSTSVNYGTFKLNFHVQRSATGTVYIYPLRAMGIYKAP